MHMVLLCYTHEFTGGMLSKKKHQPDGLNFSSADCILWEVCKHSMQRSGLWMEKKAVVINVVRYSKYYHGACATQATLLSTV